MEAKRKIYITESQAKALVKEQMEDPELTKMAGGANDHSAYPQPIRTGQIEREEVGVGTKQDEPKPDLRALPKSAEIKEAYAHLGKAAGLLLQGAPKLNNEELRSRIQKLHGEISKIMMAINADINVNEVDLAS